MRERGARFAGPVFTFLFGVFLTSNAWGSRPPSGDDVMALIIKASQGSSILRSGHLDGWDPHFLTGFPAFLHYGPGFTIAYTILRIVTLGQLSATGAIAVLYVLSFAAVGPAAYFLARSVGMNRVASTCAGVLVLGVNSPFGVGLAGLYTVGLLPHALAAPFVLVALGALIRVLREPERFLWVAVAAAALAVVIVTHVISTLITALLCIVVLGVTLVRLVPRTQWLAAALRVGIAALGAFLLSSFWLLPYWIHRNERGVVPGWPTPPLHERIDEILAGHFMLGHYVALFVIAGWAWALLAWRRNKSIVAVLPAAALAFVVFAHWYFTKKPNTELAQQLANRGIGYAGVLAMIPLGGFIDDLIRAKKYREVAAAAGVGVALLIVLVVPGKPHLKDTAKQMPEASPVAYETAAFLKRAVPMGARFATERDYPAEIGLFGVTHPDFFLAEKSGKNTVNTYGLELSQSGGAGGTTERLKDDVNGEVTADVFARYGVSHVVTVEPKAGERLATMEGFQKVFASGPVTVYSVARPLDSPRLTHVSKSYEHWKFQVETGSDLQASVPLGYSKNWKVKVDGKRVPVSKSGEGLVSFPVPAEKATIAVDWDREPWGALGLLLGIATACAAVGGRRRISTHLSRVLTPR